MCPLKTCSVLIWNTSLCLSFVPVVFLSTSPFPTDPPMEPSIQNGRIFRKNKIKISVFMRSKSHSSLWGGFVYANVGWAKLLAWHNKNCNCIVLYIIVEMYSFISSFSSYNWATKVFLSFFLSCDSFPLVNKYWSNYVDWNNCIFGWMIMVIANFPLFPLTAPPEKQPCVQPGECFTVKQ